MHHFVLDSHFPKIARFFQPRNTRLHGDAWAAAARLYGGVQAIDCGADGVGVEREGGGRAAGWWPGPPRPTGTGELEPGAALEGRAEGHSALFSPLNPSVTCHTVVIDGERKAVEERGGQWRKEKNG